MVYRDENVLEVPEGLEDGRTERRKTALLTSGIRAICELVDGAAIASSIMMPYERLEAWQSSHELVKVVYRASQKWPNAELYGLTSQTRRSAFSIPMNIAEGSAKRGSREFRRYLDMSLGSFSELSYCLLLARDLRYSTEDELAEVDAHRKKTGKLIWRLYQAISKAAMRA